MTTVEVAEVPASGGILGGPMMMYILLGSVGLSLGATVFLFREVRRLSDAASAGKRQQDEATKTLRELGESLRELSDHVAKQFAEDGRPPPPKLEAPSDLPKLEGTKKPKISDGGPRDDPRRKQKEVPTIEEVIEEEAIEETDSSCDEDGVCRIQK